MGKIISICEKETTLVYDTELNGFEVHTKNKKWKSSNTFKTSVEVLIEDKNYLLFLDQAKSIVTEEFTNGIGSGIKTKYSNWNCDGTEISACYETVIWIDNTYGYMHLELIPCNENGIRVTKAQWPAPFEFVKNSDTAYTVIPMMQGVLIPNNWPQKVEAVEPHKFYERAAYLPWWGQIEDNSGYLAIVETAWDAGYELNHPAGGPTTLNVEWLSSLGRMNYKRKLLYSFYENCDYNLLCKEYRRYVKQQGLIVTLDEKKVRNNSVERLIGSPIIHTGIYVHIKPESAYYDKDNLAANDTLNTFKKRAEQLKKLKSLGLEKAYLHLDGWGKMGYDNMHPDVMPPCEKAGGKEDLKELAETCDTLGYLFAIHDQYRDYYTDAVTYNESQAMKDIDGKLHFETIWYGGEQTALCTQLSPYYLKRNFETLKGYGIELKGAYLDVFAVIALDECADIEHMMTRKECMEKRIECFRYLTSEGILASSEEPVEWSVPYLDLVHHAPYAQEQLGEGVERGIPVPLFNLVYHDCIVVPWSTTKGGWGIPDGHSGYLYSLLNAGVPYLDIEADQDEIEKVKIVCELHEKVGNKEMLRHDFIDNNYKKQRTTFADGTVVEIDLDNDEYTIR